MKQKLLKLRKKISASLSIAALTLLAMVPTSAYASETPAAGIDINFEPSQMFTYSNVIISALMPVVYITAGLSLGFTIIYALKSAFGNRG